MQGTGMPNHIVNILTINGTPAQVEVVRNSLRGGGGVEPIDFNALIPRPPSLNVTSGEEARIASWELRNICKAASIGKPHPNAYSRADLALLEACKTNIRTHGHPTWYSWSIEHWGTKRNAYSQEDRAPNVIKFETAWSTPLPIFNALAERFPNIEFTVEYADEDIGSNQGVLIYRHGYLDERRDLPGDCTNLERRLFAYRLHGFTAEEIAKREADRESG